MRTSRNTSLARCSAPGRPGFRAAWTTFLAATLFGLALAGHAALPPLASRDGLPTLAPLLEQATPAVVNISVEQRSPEEQNPLLRDPFFRRFFGLPEQAPAQIAAGSGVIFDAREGYVITNHHVVKDASAIVVTLKDNRRLSARLIGSDAGTDVALLRIPAEELSEARFGDSDALQVGDFVVAIGNPFGIGQTVTSGIVSALGRSGLSAEAYENFIQTDASINPGNSGGALINLKGELIGINTAIIGPGGGNVGIGFAVPSNMVRAVARQLARFGEVRRGWLGVSMEDLGPGRARELGLARAQAARIAGVTPDSPAARAGLRENDIVLAIEGRPVRGAGDLRAQLAVIAAGETVEMRLLRSGKEQVLRVRIGEIEARGATAGESIAQLAGATFANVSRGRERGAIVVSVQEGGPAWRSGLRAGDVIVGVNRRRVHSIAELARALAGTGQAALDVVRGDFLLAIPVR